MMYNKTQQHLQTSLEKILINDSMSQAATITTTAETAVTRWAAPTTPAAPSNSPAEMALASPSPTPAMGRGTAWMAQTRRTACVSPSCPPALRTSTCAVQASALNSVRCATGKWTVRTAAMRKPVVRH